MARLTEMPGTAPLLGPSPGRPASLRAIMELARDTPVPTLIGWGPQLTLISNDAARLLLGGRLDVATLPEVFGAAFAEIAPRVERALAGEASTQDGFRFAAHDGRTGDTWCDIAVSAVRDEAGDVAGVVLFCHDITRHIAQQRAFRDSESRYRTLFDSMDEGFCIIEFIDGPDGPLSDYVHIEANAAYTHHAGIPNVVGQKVRTMVPAEAAGWVELYGGVLRTGTPIRFERELVATGRHLELAAFRIEPARLNHVAVLFQDITARKRAETELKALNESLEARVATSLAERKVLADIVEGTNAFVQVADMDYRWLAINSAAAREFERIFGVAPKVGDRMLDLLSGYPAEQAAVAAVWGRALAGEEFVEVAAFGDPARDRRHYEMRFNVLRDRDGTRVGAYQFVYDVTERLRDQERLHHTEAALRQAQKMESLGQLTGGVAHDFNNLLAVFASGLQILERADGIPRPRVFEAMRRAIARGTGLTRHLLAFSRRHPVNPESIDIVTHLKGMRALLDGSLIGTYLNALYAQIPPYLVSSPPTPPLPSAPPSAPAQSTSAQPASPDRSQTPSPPD